MQIQWIGYQYSDFDGYGRYGSRMIWALQRAGLDVQALLSGHVTMPDWMQKQAGISWGGLSISCLPAYFLRRVPGRHWLYTMTEGSAAPDGWAEIINASGVERLIVPCQANAEAFCAAGVNVPVHVVAGGTDPDEFPAVPRTGNRGSSPEAEPYTFLALADRGQRKGWGEVYQAFYAAFGRPQDTPDVRLILKSRPNGNELLDLIAGAPGLDPRIVVWREDVDHPGRVYAHADCFVIPSRFEGWGMPHREAAMMGLPVITQAVGGVDDGHTHEWAYVVAGGTWEPIPSACEQIDGLWLRCDVEALAARMRTVYENPHEARRKGALAAGWLRDHQTWDHAAEKLMRLFEEVL